ncbi:DNA repair helicase xpb1-like [Anaeramoeba flamelloides]|uniref:DNA repair helicase xpb1-like n=1 Tax=Anaeramoeba flamelloides TaxID=1746091 RepID=A0ABQ8XQ47_9EUKA|nr:DNA repair helicase xpb1-like [Anaeramoeba flamelloides]
MGSGALLLPKMALVPQEKSYNPQVCTARPKNRTKTSGKMKKKQSDRSVVSSKLLLSKKLGTKRSTKRSTKGSRYVDENIKQRYKMRRHNVKFQFKHGNFSSLKLKRDHAARPIWVCPDKHIFLECFNPYYKQATDFLIAISDPVSRPELVHEYHLTTYSLYAAVSIGLTTKTILSVLNKFCKNKIPQNVADFITSCTKSYGKVKLVLKQGNFFLESNNKDVLEKLVKDKIIHKAIDVNNDQNEFSSNLQNNNMNQQQQQQQQQQNQNGLQSSNSQQNYLTMTNVNQNNSTQQFGNELNDLSYRLMEKDEEQDYNLIKIIESDSSSDYEIEELDDDDDGDDDDNDNENINGSKKNKKTKNKNKKKKKKSKFEVYGSSQKGSNLSKEGALN